MEGKGIEFLGWWVGGEFRRKAGRNMSNMTWLPRDYYRQTGLWEGGCGSLVQGLLPRGIRKSSNPVVLILESRRPPLVIVPFGICHCTDLVAMLLRVAKCLVPALGPHGISNCPNLVAEPS